MIIKGVHYHFKECSKCGATFYTAARYSHPPLCKECSKGANILSLSREEVMILRDIRNGKNTRR